MKRLIVMLAVAGLVGTMPVVAAEKPGAGKQDVMMECVHQSETIQDKVAKIKAEIAKGNKAYTAEELQSLEKKLKEVNDFLDAMSKN